MSYPSAFRVLTSIDDFGEPDRESMIVRKKLSNDLVYEIVAGKRWDFIYTTLPI